MTTLGSRGLGWLLAAGLTMACAGSAPDPAGKLGATFTEQAQAATQSARAAEAAAPPETGARAEPNVITISAVGDAE